jgi:hypothetical protein
MTGHTRLRLVGFASLFGPYSICAQQVKKAVVARSKWIVS